MQRFYKQLELKPFNPSEVLFEGNEALAGQLAKLVHMTFSDGKDEDFIRKVLDLQNKRRTTSLGGENGEQELNKGGKSDYIPVLLQKQKKSGPNSKGQEGQGSG